MEIAVLISGGVDSSVALGLLQKQGIGNLRAYYLKIWLEDELSFLGNCPWEEDLAYIEQVCRHLHIPLEVVSMQREYFETIVAYTIEELRSGNTPSPDVFCNRHIKFGAFLTKIGDFNADFVATGHYAQIVHQGDKSHLLRAVDPIKDQTYFLSQLLPSQLKKVLFPIGHLAKSQVRLAAQELQLATMSRKDSQGLCFLGKIPFDEFIKYHLGEKKGPIVEKESGKILGHHQGYWFHTIGQRKGLGLSGGPWFVVEKNTAENVLLVSHNENIGSYLQREFLGQKVNWYEAPDPKLPLTCKVRHGQKEYPCTVTSNSSNDTIQIHLLEGGDKGIANGQIVVFYQGDHCLGGATIKLIQPSF